MILWAFVFISQTEYNHDRAMTLTKRRITWTFLPNAAALSVAVMK